MIIVGDSFCSSLQGWPGIVANQLEQPLRSAGFAGQHWWSQRCWLETQDVNSAEYIIFVHTMPTRIPNDDPELAKVNWSNPDLSNNLDRAVDGYFKYVQDVDFLLWANLQWFREITRRWGSKKLVHLHAFPETLSSRFLLDGMHFVEDLTSLSLQELNGDMSKLYNDQRPNHFSINNNQVIADQICQEITNYTKRDVFWDISKFKFGV